MARDGNGVYTPLANTWNPAVSGQTIDPDDWAELLADIAAALTASLAADGQTTATARVPFAVGVSVPVGSVSAPSVAIIGDPNTGIYSPGTDQIAAAAGGVQAWASDGSVLTLPGGVKFPASQAASANANTLDDYEEGTFTPALKFGGASVGLTYSTQTGRYTKVGRLVTFEIILAISAIGSSTGAVTLEGLPFVVGAGGAVAWSTPAGGFVSYANPNFAFLPSTTILSGYNAEANMTHATFQAGTNLNLSGVYTV